MQYQLHHEKTAINATNGSLILGAKVWPSLKLVWSAWGISGIVDDNILIVVKCTRSLLAGNWWKKSLKLVEELLCEKRTIWYSEI